MNSRMYNDFMSSSNNMNNLDGIFQAYKSWPGFWVEDENGNVVYGSTTEQTKEALGELQKMYADGLLDQELGVRKDADEAWKGGKAGILFSRGGMVIVWDLYMKLFRKQIGKHMQHLWQKTDSGIQNLEKQAVLIA